MSVLYKFKNVVDFDAVKFDGVYISASDLKAIITQQKKLTNCGVQIMDEETQHIYKDEEQIPKNTKVIITRTPLANNNKRARMSNSHNNNSNSSGNTNGSASGQHNNNHHNDHHHYRNNGHHNYHHSQSSGSSSSQDHSGSGHSEAFELVSTKNMSEEEKIKQIQIQSTQGFEPKSYPQGGRSGFKRGRGGRFPPRDGYRCFKCGIPGHSVYDCKFLNQPKVKKAHGIPRDFLMKADPKDKGALMTPSGEYAVPILDAQAYSNPKVEKAPFFEDGISNDDASGTR